MKHNTFKNAMISMLSVCILLLLSSQAVYAAKPVKVPPTPTTVIHSVVVDITSNTIVVSGAELATITEVTLGGLAVTFNSTDGSTGVINFTDIDDVVTGVLTAGNYALIVGDNRFSIYLSSADAAAITPPDPVDYTACPCYADWEQFGTNYGYIGFEGASGSYVVNTAEQTTIFINTGLEGWWLDTNFDGTSGTCSTPDYVLGVTFMSEPLTTQAEHDTCVDYLTTTYIN